MLNSRFLPCDHYRYLKWRCDVKALPWQQKNCVLPKAAVSRQVQELELRLDIKLFVRSGPQLKVTATGKALAERIGQAMDTLHEAVQKAHPHPYRRHITLSMLPSLNTKWFAPRLGRFIQSHPDIDLRIAATQDLVVDFDADEIDAAIRYGPGNWTHLSAELLAEETVTPVCTRAYAERANLKVPGDLLNATLLQTESKDNWTAWFQAAGVEHHEATRGPYLGDGSAILQAVKDGQGVALGRSISDCRRLAGRVNHCSLSTATQGIVQLLVRDPFAQDLQCQFNCGTRLAKTVFSRNALELNACCCGLEPELLANQTKRFNPQT